MIENDKTITVTNEMATIALSKEYYQREAVFAAANTLSSICDVHINPIDEFTVGVFLKNVKVKDSPLESLAERLCKEVLDQQIRLDLERRFAPIRKLIVQHAFNPIRDLNEEIKRNV